jgi:hypothetical protein
VRWLWIAQRARDNHLDLTEALNDPLTGKADPGRIAFLAVCFVGLWVAVQMTLHDKDATTLLLAMFAALVTHVVGGTLATGKAMQWTGQKPPDPDAELPKAANGS